MNLDKYLLQKSEKLTATAKNIFGDIVENVYIAKIKYEWDTIEDTNSELILELNRIEEHIDINSKKIDQDCTSIVIEYTNGKKVIFNNSECVYMSTLEDSVILKL